MRETQHDIEELRAGDQAAVEPSVSVCIATHNRRELLTRTLHALEQQTLPRNSFEVVVVDDGSPDGTSEMLRDWPGPLNLRAYRYPVPSGPAAKRNVAWRHARGPVIAFTDDDCRPVPEWLEKGLEALHREDAVVGRTRPDPAQRLGPFSRSMWVEDVNWVPTCNVFYQRNDIEAVGGFDETFAAPGGEDTDLAYRIQDQLGRVFGFEAEALVNHEIRQSRFFEAAKEAQRWTTIPLFFKLHPEARERIYRRYFWKPTHPRAILAALGLVMAVAHHPAYAIAAMPWLHHRTRHNRAPGHVVFALPALPGTFLIDLIEVGTMIRGSIRHRTFLL